MWFKNLPVRLAIIDVEGYNKGFDAQLYEQIFTIDITNEELNNKVFFISKIDKCVILNLITIIELTS